ncbi:MAG: 4-phosphopantetheinyl transferase [Myxococcales bacterium]|nr:4-phosphopantetheinyl transferase [Myxococcales bacterium]
MTAQPFDVRVICCRATPSAAYREVLHAAITTDEQRRRGRFFKAVDADRFLVGRGTLRREVGRMLGIPPREVAFELGEHDKPHVVGGTPHVNVSHSGDVVLIALTSGVPIGIDVEQINERFAHEAVHETFFSDREIEDLAKVPADLRVPAFFHTWTSREAIMKVLGLGLNLPRETFDVSVDPRLPPALLAARTPLLTAGPHTLISIAVPSGHLAALAVAADSHAFRVSVVSDPAYSDVT